MRGPAARGAAALALTAGILGAAACGKKAPLRLPDQVKAEPAGALRAAVREGAVTITFRVPARRVFPEREEPWVLARVLRREGASPDFVEAGAVLDAAGLPFGEELAWVDGGRAAGVALAYRVEFRDERRRRRALTPVLELAWTAVPGAPGALAARGATGAVALSWQPPAGSAEGVRYRVFRREEGGAAAALAGSEVSAPAFSDSRVRPGREYCYAVRAFVAGIGTEVEGPAAEEVCARAGGGAPPEAPRGLRVRPAGRAFQLTWEPVSSENLAGYAVYRAVGDGPPGRVTTTPVAGTAFLDDPGEVPPGTVLRWTVTAVERSEPGGESAMSEGAAAVAGAP